MLRGGCVGKRRRWGAEEQRQELGARAAVARLDGPGELKRVRGRRDGHTCKSRLGQVR